MTTTADLVSRIAEDSGFAGVVRVDRGDRIEVCAAYGMADRAHGIPMTVGHQLAIASGSKAFTALAVMSLVTDGRLSLETTARSVLGEDLPLIPADVTVQHLLTHRSGIGDYLDEDDESVSVEDYPMPVSVHQLASTDQFLRILDGHPPKFAAGQRFSYCNSGYVVLALIAERVSGQRFHDLVRQRVCRPAGLAETDFLRSDALPGRAALGYLQIDGQWRTNVFHLPVLGNGDGGIYTTAADLRSFWAALFDGRIIPIDALQEMLRPRSDPPGSESLRYGMGFWLGPTDNRVIIEGMDAGVSFRGVYRPSDQLCCTVIGTTTDAAWPIVGALAPHLSTAIGAGTPIEQ